MAIDETTSSRPTSLATSLNMRAVGSSGAKAQPLVGSAKNSALGLANANSQGARPAFNLLFNQMQNTVIDRLNAKITQVQNDNSHARLDGILTNERQKLLSLANDIDPVRESMISNSYTLDNMGNLLDQLNGAAADAEAGDPTEFNRLLTGLNEASAKIQIVDGGAIGLVVGDGSDKLKHNGLLQVTPPGGQPQQATSYADFATPTDALSAITDAMYHLANVQTSAQVRTEVMATIMDETSKGIQKIDTQLQLQQSLDIANKAGEVAKLKQQYGFMLQALSIAFEGSQSMADTLGTRLLGGAAVDRGSVMSLFT